MFLHGTDSQQSDEIEIDRDLNGAESAATSQQGEFESNAQDQAEEFDTDLPAEHNVHTWSKVTQTKRKIE